MAINRSGSANGDYQKTILKNGLRIVTETIPSVRSISLGVWVDVGSRNETAQENGASHLIEHLVFKGTKKRTAKQIAASLEELGGSLNAFTSREQTCYTARILDEHLEDAIDVLSDITCRATFTPTNIRREKMVVAEEIKESVDNPGDLIIDLFCKTYWSRHPLGRPIMGSIETITNLPRAGILDYVKRNYRAGSIVIAAAGSVSHSKLVRLVKKYFDFAEGSAPPPEEQHRRVSKKIEIKSNKNQQTHVCLGFPGVELASKDKMTALSLSTYLGAGMSSVLFQKIREQLGLVYTVYTFNDFYRDTGIFGSYLGTSKPNLKRAVDIILKECYRMKKSRISTDTLDKVKAQLKGHITLAMESTSSHMSRLGRQELVTGKYQTLRQTLNDINRITPSNVMELANRIFDPSQLAVAVLGPADKDVFDHV